MVKKDKIVLEKGKRKTAIARVRIKKGSGAMTVNDTPLAFYGSQFARSEILVPVGIAHGVLGKDFEKTLDIDVKVEGGGWMGQAEAVKTALGKGLVKWTESDELKQAFNGYDRTLLVDDVRRKESKKPLGRGARKKRQKSYR
jgi:small subunit ribosomal protein S9